ncbi:MAG: hypothetical protein JOZ90_13450 [Alphaproteobacteria bacterium]|nr:hypothetical protein [Alphaproteobacteria bacterium]MBV9372889.1 hypothetical protein [Alphaproteobacteria bacterium]MBV9902077.1 hypothetical protein [Alphaproteobacteria bacterium]
MFDFTKFQQGVVAAIAAFVLTATAVGAAVGPARAIETAPAASLRA